MIMNYSKYANLPGIAKHRPPPYAPVQRTVQKPTGQLPPIVKPEEKSFTLDDLSTLTPVIVTREIPFPVIYDVIDGQPVFSAELKGGDYFEIRPLIPRSARPSLDASMQGEPGYLTLSIREDATFTRSANGKIETRSRSTFVGWEPREARDARLAKESAEEKEEAARDKNPTSV